MKKKSKKEGKKPDNVIYIGKKPVKNYTNAIVIARESGAKTVVLMARANAIRTACDVSQYAKRLMNMSILATEIGTETFKDKKDPKQSFFVSTIRIDLIPKEV